MILYLGRKPICSVISYYVICLLGLFRWTTSVYFNLTIWSGFSHLSHLSFLLSFNFDLHWLSWKLLYDEKLWRIVWGSNSRRDGWVWIPICIADRPGFGYLVFLFFSAHAACSSSHSVRWKQLVPEMALSWCVYKICLILRDMRMLYRFLRCQADNVDGNSSFHSLRAFQILLPSLICVWWSAKSKQSSNAGPWLGFWI